MRPDAKAHPEYILAFQKVVGRLGESLSGIAEEVLPIKMYIAGGAAMHFYTGERLSRDIDASFSHRIILPQDLEASYRDTDGSVRLLYFDYQYNDSFALMHEDAREEAIPLTLPGMDKHVLVVHLLSALDLAVSKISRFSSQDRDDIAALARQGLIDSTSLKKRAEAAAGAYIGNPDSLKTSIKLACGIVGGIEKRSQPPTNTFGPG